MADKSDWSGSLGAEWARQAAVMERMLGPFGIAAMDTLGDLTAARVLDLGCGGGATTFELARRVGAKGAAVGIDISPDLIALASEQRRNGTAAEQRAGFREADAATAAFGVPFDALFSQFGSMFFDAPVPAFVNLRKAMKPDAPLGIACWQAPAKNNWAMLALNAAKPLLPPAPPTDRSAPGPFAWADPQATFLPILERAGWRDIAFRPFETVVPLGEGMADDPLEAALAFSLRIGPLASRLRSVDADLRSRVVEVVREVLAAQPLTPERGVGVTGAAWLVTARA